MLQSPMLDVAIGMAFIFLTLSLIASVIQELLSSLVQSRPANLFNGIRSLLSGNLDLVLEFYKHGLIAGLYRNAEHDFGMQAIDVRSRITSYLQPFLGVPLKNMTQEQLGSINAQMLPAYIPARTFAVAMIDILNTDQKEGSEILPAITLRLKDKLSQFPADHVKHRSYEALYSIATRASKDLGTFQSGLEDWYNDGMDRVSGWYKKYTQNILLVIGFLLAASFNVDSIHIARVLWVDRDVRQAWAAEATAYLKQNPTPPTSSNTRNQANVTAAPSPKDATGTPQMDKTKLEAALKELNNLNSSTLSPIGWHSLPANSWHAAFSDPLGGLFMLFGWVITAMALSLGAPFWFDTLNKFMVVRSTVKPQEKSRTDKNKDN